MRYFIGNLLFIVISVVFFTIYFTRFLDGQKPLSSAAEPPAAKRQLVLEQRDTMIQPLEWKTDGEMEVAPRTNIFFLKTHKCGSSSVQNIIMRFGLKNGLDFVLPETANYLGNPRYFTKSMIGRLTRTPNGIYNIFTHHTRFNQTSVHKIMSPTAAYVTILRKPADLYESLYNYYDLEKKYKMNLTTFLENYSNIKRLRRGGSRFGYNQMCFDLGLNEREFEDNRKIKKWIKKIDRAFDLVMMTEYMDESLILLADLMKWPLENLVTIKLRVRSPTKRTHLTPNQRKILRNLNKCDTKLQDYFFKKFRQRIKTYGIQKMSAKLREFIKINDEFHRRCEIKSNMNTSFTIKYNTAKNIDTECTYAVTEELKFTNLLRKVQRQRVFKLRSLNRLMKNKTSFKS